MSIPSSTDDGFEFTWHEVGESNPFQKRLLDVRPLTKHMISTTKDENIAKRFNELRNVDGGYLENLEIETEESAETDIEYPFGEEKLNGPIFKADSMECKWDIYVFDQTLYFVRSWTGILIYKADFRIIPNKLILTRVYYSKKQSSNEALNTVHFILMTHILGNEIPHTVPVKFKDDQEIALYSFTEFGKYASFATYDKVTDLRMRMKLE